MARVAPAASPIRRLDLWRDLDAVAALVETAFRDEPGRDAHQFRSELRSLRSFGPLLWLVSRILPFGAEFLTGFVCVEAGAIIGCLTLSLLPGFPPRWLIANVAVDPQYRRRGIARQLCERAIEHVARRGDGLIVLDVRQENHAAYSLYEKLGFTVRETVTERQWLPGVTWPQAVPAAAPIRFEPLAPTQWRLAHALLNETLPISAREVSPVVDTDLMTFGLFGRLPWSQRGFSTLDTHRLVAGSASRLDGLLVVRAQRWVGVHTLQIYLRPSYAETLASPSVATALSLLRRYPPSPVAVTLRSPSPELLAALDAVGFQERQTLHRLALRV